MPELHDGALLRIYIGDDDTYGERPLYEAIVRAAHDAGLAGATVLRGLLGFGRSAHLHEIHKGFSHALRSSSRSWTSRQPSRHGCRSSRTCRCCAPVSPP